MLSQDDYYHVCSKMNVTSIDMILDYKGKYLLGKRINEPAKNTYFVVGGTIQKNETLAEAFKRLSRVELGIELTMDTFQFHVISQHWYDKNFKDDTFGTHYISLSYKRSLTDEEFQQIHIDDQHSEMLMLTRDELMASDEVHANTKGFFDSNYFAVK